MTDVAPFKGLGEWYSQVKGREARQRPVGELPPEPGGTGVSARFPLPAGFWR